MLTFKEKHQNEPQNKINELTWYFLQGCSGRRLTIKFSFLFFFTLFLSFFFPFKDLLPTKYFSFCLLFFNVCVWHRSNAFSFRVFRTLGRKQKKEAGRDGKIENEIEGKIKIKRGNMRKKDDSKKWR